MAKKKPQYKNLKFKTEAEFEAWLEQKTKYIANFNEMSFDPTRFYIDHRGEILHSDLQGFVWNSKMIDIPTLVKHKRILFNDGSMLNYPVVELVVKELMKAKKHAPIAR